MLGPHVAPGLGLALLAAGARHGQRLGLGGGPRHPLPLRGGRRHALVAVLRHGLGRQALNDRNLLHREGLLELGGVGGDGREAVVLPACRPAGQVRRFLLLRGGV